MQENEETLYANRMMSVIEKKFDEIDFKFLLTKKNKDAAAILLYNINTEKLILIEQFRPAAGKEIVEIICGVIDEGETPEIAAVRESIEESGYSPTDIRFVNEMFVSPGWTTEKFYCYFAIVKSTDKVNEGGGTDADERITVLEVDPDEAHAWTKNGKIVDSKTLCMLNWFFYNYKNIKDGKY